MRVQPVVTHANAQASGHPVQESRHGDSAPVDHEKGCDGAGMKQHEDDCGEPVHALTIRWAEDFSAHCISAKQIFKIGLPVRERPHRQRYQLWWQLEKSLDGGLNTNSTV
jgi:hypothetical protein